MLRKIVVISTCTNRKKTLGYPIVSLSSCFSDNWETSLSLWLNLIQERSNCKIEARKLYAGNHWQETLSCQNSIQKQEIESDLWIMSAGMGLISDQVQIPPYSATFASGPDSVHSLKWLAEYGSKEHCKFWWQGINRNRHWDGPHTLLEIPDVTEKDVCVMMICSPMYLYAVEPELLELSSVNDNLLIFCAGLNASMNLHPILSNNILPIDDRFKGHSQDLVGVNSALNARTAHWLAEKHMDWIQQGQGFVMTRLKEIADSLPPLQKKDLNPMTDDEILDFIGKHYSSNASATPLLRMLRGELGKSCEQKRFGRLFEQYKHNLNLELDL